MRFIELEMRIKFLKSYNGDSILLNFTDDRNCVRNILIDGGTSTTYKGKGKSKGELKNEIDIIRSKGEFIDLLILTHIDDDHIGGIKKWLSTDSHANTLIKKVWFNSGKLIASIFKESESSRLNINLSDPDSTNTSVKQGIEFNDYLMKHGIELQSMQSKQEEIIFGLNFKFLSPNENYLRKLLNIWEQQETIIDTSGIPNDYDISIKDHIKNDFFVEDSSITNGSSIAFIMTYNGLNFLFLGDAHPSVVVEGLRHFGYSKDKQLEAEFVKLSHHGSSGNYDNYLLEIVNSNKYIICSNGEKYSHPHKQLLARIIKSYPECKLLFNYNHMINKIFMQSDYNEFSTFTTSFIDNDLEY